MEASVVIERCAQQLRASPDGPVCKRILTEAMIQPAINMLRMLLPRCGLAVETGRRVAAVSRRSPMLDDTSL